MHSVDLFQKGKLLILTIIIHVLTLGFLAMITVLVLNHKTTVKSTVSVVWIVSINIYYIEWCYLLIYIVQVETGFLVVDAAKVSVIPSTAPVI